MDLRTYVGGFKNILTESADHCRRIAIDQPVLTHANFAKLAQLNEAGFVRRPLIRFLRQVTKPVRCTRARGVFTEVERRLMLGHPSYSQ